MNWWQYLLLSNLYLLLFYGFYVVFLRKETFFYLNRIYLITSVLLSFLIPFIQSDWVDNLFITQQIKHYVIYGQPIVNYQYTYTDTGISINQLLLIIYVTGVVVGILKLINQLLTIRNRIRKPFPLAPFSFFKKIVVSNSLPNSHILIAHEKVHVKQWHSADVLLMELLIVFNWFNPIVYCYRKATKHIHEYIADSEVVHLSSNKADYALMLLNHAMNNPPNNLTNQFFNQTLLKQRIMMLQKNKSQRIRLAKYGLYAPLFTIMVVLSSATMGNSSIVKAISDHTKKTLNTPIKQSLSTAIPTNKEVEAYTPSTKVSATDTKPPLKTTKLSLANTADTIPGKDDKLYQTVQKQPQFPGGIQEFYKFLSKNMSYPKEAKENKQQGRVFLTFIVEKNGSLSNITVKRGLNNSLDKEALRMLALSPKWEPGYLHDKPVRVEFVLPIEFRLPLEIKANSDTTSSL